MKNSTAMVIVALIIAICFGEYLLYQNKQEVIKASQQQKEKEENKQKEEEREKKSLENSLDIIGNLKIVILSMWLNIMKTVIAD
jgi:H+/gluconate symporter-like permease